MFFELISVASLFFLVPLAIAGCVISDFLDHSKKSEATVLAVVVIIATLLFTDLRPFAMVTSEPLRLLLILGAYVVTGTVWAIMKWGFWLAKLRGRVQDIEAEVTERHGRKDLILFNMQVIHRLSDAKLPTTLPPKAKEHAPMISGWMMFWPCSALWTLINDPVRHAFKWAHRSIEGLLQGMSDRAFSHHIKPAAKKD